jgi:hypothetical protein
MSIPHLMSIPDLILAINKIAWGERGNLTLRHATGNPSPVVLIVEAYDDLRSRIADLAEDEIEILRQCCIHISEGQWWGRALEAIDVRDGLPPPSTPSAAMMVAPPLLEATSPPTDPA